MLPLHRDARRRLRLIESEASEAANESRGKIAAAHSTRSSKQESL